MQGMHVRATTALHALAELLRTIVLIQEVMGNLLQVGKMAVKERGSNGEEVRVARVVHLDNTPGVLAGADRSAADLDNVLGADNGEGHEPTELCVLLDGVLVILLDVVGEVVYGDPVVLDIFHNKLLRLGELSGGQRIGAADDGNDVNAGSETLHELDVELSEARIHKSCQSAGNPLSINRANS